VLFGVKISAPGGVTATREELVESLRMFGPRGCILGPDAYLSDVMEVVRKPET